MIGITKKKLTKIAVLSSVVIAVIAIGIASTLAAMGAWWQPELDPLRLPEEIEILTRGKPIGQDLPVDSSQAGNVVREMEAFISQNPLPGQTVAVFEYKTRRPLSPLCPAMTPTIMRSASTSGAFGVVTVGIEVYGAGLGQRALDTNRFAATACGAATENVDRVGKSGYSGAGGQIREVRWRYGDIVMAVATYNGPMPGEVAQWVNVLDQKLRENMTTGICRDPGEPEEAAKRNYTQPDYQQYRREITVDLPEGSVAPQERISTTDLPVFAPPPLGTVTVKPTPPPRPSYPQAKSPIVDYDRKGPGCGWGFTGMAGPPEDRKETVERNREELAAAQEYILQQWQTWPSQVETWRQQQAQYVADNQSFEQWQEEEEDRERDERRQQSRATTTTTTVPRPGISTTTTAPTTTTLPPTTSTIAPRDVPPPATIPDP